MRTHLQRAGTLFGLLLALPAANAGSLTVESADLTLSGGMAGGYYRTTNINQKDVDQYYVSDFLIGLSSESNNGSIGFTSAFGHLAEASVWDGGVNNSASGTPVDYYPSTMDFQYGWLSVPVGGGVTVDAGQLATNVGYEIAPSFSNANILLGAVWYSQPVYYTGVRATWAGDGFSVFAETNDDSATGSSKTSVFGVSGSAGGFNYLVSYDNAFYKTGRDILDVIVSSTLGGIDMAVNLDYQKIDKVTQYTPVALPANADDSAYGLALYATFPVSSMVSVPVRVEYINDGTSSIYGGVDSGYTFTVTPTYKASENTFLRGELAYVSAKNDVFKDDSAAAQGTNTSFALQAGVTF